MNKLGKLKEVTYIFGSKIADIFHNKVVKGSKYRFFKLQLNEALNYPLNVVAGRIKPLARRLARKKIARKNEDFIIKNKTGTFTVNSKNDSLIMSSHFYDPFQKKWIKSENKNIFLDIGANIGHYTLLARKEGFSRIICFEPDPDTYKILTKNITLNKLKNVETYQLGAGNINGKVKFEKDLFNTGGNRFLTEEDKKDKNQNPSSKKHPLLNVVRLDDFLSKHKVDFKKIDFIKIDVEGFELDVLKGMPKIIKSLNKGAILMIEVWDRSPKRNETLNLIKKNKFTLINKYDDNYLFRLDK